MAFRGAHSYLSPTVYPDLQRVPTWDYVVVHCRVQVDLVDEVDDKDALLKCLIADHEPAYAEQWRGLDADYARKMLGAIVGHTTQNNSKGANQAPHLYMLGTYVLFIKV